MTNVPSSFAALPKEKQEKVKRLLARKLALEAMQRRAVSRAKQSQASEWEKKDD